MVTTTVTLKAAKIPYKDETSKRTFETTLIGLYTRGRNLYFLEKFGKCWEYEPLDRSFNQVCETILNQENAQSIKLSGEAIEKRLKETHRTGDCREGSVLITGLVKKFERKLKSSE